MTIEILITVVIIAFILEFFDASAGMGFGTLTPILFLLGYPALEVISAVIFTSAVLSLFAGFLHHSFENINFLVKRNIKILSILIGFGIIAITVGALVAINIPEHILKTYIGILITVIGISILITHHKKNRFSIKRLIAFGSIASFNKGISGGGYGPVLAGGQIISGIKSKHAVGITALSEGFISMIGFLAYLFINGPTHMNWSLITSVLIGGILSTPIAVYAVKISNPKILKVMIGSISIILGILIIAKLF